MDTITSNMSIQGCTLLPGGNIPIAALSFMVHGFTCSSYQAPLNIILPEWVVPCSSHVISDQWSCNRNDYGKAEGKTLQNCHDVTILSLPFWWLLSIGVVDACTLFSPSLRELFITICHLPPLAGHFIPETTVICRAALSFLFYQNLEVLICVDAKNYDKLIRDEDDDADYGKAAMTMQGRKKGAGKRCINLSVDNHTHPYPPIPNHIRP